MGAVLTRAAPSHLGEASTRTVHPQASPRTISCTSRLQKWHSWIPSRPSASCGAAWEMGVSPGRWPRGHGFPDGSVLLQELGNRAPGTEPSLHLCLEPQAAGHHPSFQPELCPGHHRQYGRRDQRSQDPGSPHCGAAARQPHGACFLHPGALPRPR